MTAAKRIADITGGHVLEEGVPFSRSRLWDFERAYYERQGLRAWSEGEVPSAITSNPVMASAYAEVIVAFLRDCDAAGHLDRRRPVHVLELGSGSGQLAFGLVRRLRQLLAATRLGDQPVTVVLSDFDRAKLEQLATHPRLQDDLASGWLDVAVVDASAPGVVRTWRRRELLADGPLVVVANYVFDSLPADVYAIGEGAVHEVGLTLSADAADLDRHDPTALGRLRLTWEAATTPAPPTGHPGLDAVLARYAEVLDTTMVVLPTAALGCLELLAGAARAPTLALVADKGWADLRDLAGRGAPVLVPNGGSFSTMLNFDALARVVRAGGGTALLPPHHPQQLVVGAFVLGGLAVPETAQRYADVLAEGGPDDLHAVRSSGKATAATLTSSEALSVLRACRWDSRTFVQVLPALQAGVEHASPMDRRDLALAVRRVWEMWFPIGEAVDIALSLGSLLAQIGRHREALEMYAASLRFHGPGAAAHLAAAR
ncbi:MAG: SAM-dependent methyltransferase, partial [Acidimicrobiales bacterium]